MNEFLLTGSLFFLVPFALLSPIDGIYLHLIKYKLQEHPESQKEHLAHTARALLFIPIALMLFNWNLSGPALWILVGLITADLVAEAIDVLEERKSRAQIGGISNVEYLIHVLLTTTRVAALSLALASKPAEAWSTSMNLPEYPQLVKFIGSQLIPGAIIISLIHIILIFKPMLVSQVIAKFQKSSLS